jgi:hypothetical protein
MIAAISPEKNHHYLTPSTITPFIFYKTRGNSFIFASNNLSSHVWHTTKLRPVPPELLI